VSRRTSPTGSALTRAVNRLVAERPAVAALVLIAAVVLTWALMRQAEPDVPAVAPPSTAVTSTEPAPAAGAQTDPVSGLPYVAESQLPTKAREVLAAIRAGGPFEFDEDGTVFGNYEGLLPEHVSGYYREYTVQLPGERTRGAHRLVVGDHGEVYWTEDHYQSFSVVKEGA